MGLTLALLRENRRISGCLRSYHRLLYPSEEATLQNLLVTVGTKSVAVERNVNEETFVESGRALEIIERTRPACSFYISWTSLPGREVSNQGSRIQVLSF
jgi:hypothetical protein